MTEQLEYELRRLFAEDAEQAPDLAFTEYAHRWVRRRRRTRLAWGTGVLVTASAAGVAALGGELGAGTPAVATVTAQSAPSSVPPATTVATRPTGPLPEAGAAECLEEFSAPRSLTEVAFAFDGTVASVGPGHSDRPGADFGLVGVTFTVNEWFTGGPGATITVDLPPPGDRGALSEEPPAYERGSRLLVSGTHRWGGTTMADAIAWGCGFTRYYDEATAGSWRAATR